MRAILATIIFCTFVFIITSNTAQATWGSFDIPRVDYNNGSPWRYQFHFDRRHYHYGSRIRRSPRQGRVVRSNHFRWQHSRSVGLSGACQLARRQGGPCGCVAQENIFGTSARIFHGLNLWLARTWLAFPRTSPAPGMAAVWGAHHVEAIVAVNGDGTITTDGPYGHRRVHASSVAIVNPHGGAHYAARHERRHRYVYRHRFRYRHYARAQ